MQIPCVLCLLTPRRLELVDWGAGGPPSGINSIYARSPCLNPADVHGADGKRIGRVRYGFAFRRPLDGLLKAYRAATRAGRPKRISEPDPRDPAASAVALAQAQPSQVMFCF